MTNQITSSIFWSSVIFVGLLCFIAGLIISYSWGYSVAVEMMRDNAEELCRALLS